MILIPDSKYGTIYSSLDWNDDYMNCYTKTFKLSKNKNADEIFQARKIDRDSERKFWLQIDFPLDDG